MLRLKPSSSAPKLVPRHRNSSRATKKQADASQPTLASRAHPLASTKLLTIDMEFDNDTQSFVTYVKELHGMSTFGKTELEALDKTAEMIRGYIKSMEANGRKIPLSSRKLGQLKQIVGIH